MRDSLRNRFLYMNRDWDSLRNRFLITWTEIFIWCLLFSEPEIPSPDFKNDLPSKSLKEIVDLAKDVDLKGPSLGILEVDLNWEMEPNKNLMISLSRLEQLKQDKSLLKKSDKSIDFESIELLVDEEFEAKERKVLESKRAVENERVMKRNNCLNDGKQLKINLEGNAIRINPFASKEGNYNVASMKNELNVQNSDYNQTGKDNVSTQSCNRISENEDFEDYGLDGSCPLGSSFSASSPNRSRMSTNSTPNRLSDKSQSKSESEDDGAHHVEKDLDKGKAYRKDDEMNGKGDCTSESTSPGCFDLKFDEDEFIFDSDSFDDVLKGKL